MKLKQGAIDAPLVRAQWRTRFHRAVDHQESQETITEPFPDEWEALIASRARDGLFERLDRGITAAGYLPRSGRILDATLVAAPQHWRRS